MSDTSSPPHLDDSASATKPLRADARRNRERLLAAAREVFAEQGRDAQIDDVARRAGLGIGTVYRHFPTKDALLEALAVDHFERLQESALAELDSDDPAGGFQRLLWRAAEHMRDDRALCDAMSEDALEVSARARARLTGIAVTIMRRAQAAGSLRADFQPDDLPMLMCGLAAAVRRGASDDSWRRYVELLCDGLRPPRG